VALVGVAIVTPVIGFTLASKELEKRAHMAGMIVDAHSISMPPQRAPKDTDLRAWLRRWRPLILLLAYSVLCGVAVLFAAHDLVQGDVPEVDDEGNVALDW